MKRNYLIVLRTQHNESQQDVANGIGITRQYYSLIEGGERQKQMDIMLATLLAAHFRVPIADFVKQE